ncbi:hypothetical protein [Mesorhizobium sp. 128a]
MHQIDDTKKLVNHFDETERKSLLAIKETKELIERNRLLIERSRRILSSVSEMAARQGPPSAI